MDGLHTWPIHKIKKGNERDRAQTLTDIITFLREEEQKKMYGSIERYFQISKTIDEPRIGIQNSGSLQNMMIKMATFDADQNKLMFSDMACLCSSCNFGRFELCGI